MVEKRTLIFASIAILIWAVLASNIAGYFYFQNMTYKEQNIESQQSRTKIAADYNESIVKYNTLLSEYSKLYGKYSFPLNINFTSLTKELGKLIVNLRGNYSILTKQKDLNETYQTLWDNYLKLSEEGNITREKFGELLNEYHELFNLLALRELNEIISETVTLTVNICIEYKNETLEWHNKTEVPAGSTLFQLTCKIANITYTYYPTIKPGHILVNCINGENSTNNWYWLWYYWSENKKTWIEGPVGCDAWMLKDGGIYKWKIEHLSWP
ncbi:hypothetical protein J7L49_01505 [Candidatus Bathyarchaeota archaeon]|nr:hypothetical protein [Candidatus Bathyarchaeota archaeon]